MKRRLKARGYALSELLVAVAITGLVVGVLTFLNVDYIGFARRVVGIGQPYDIGRRLEAQANGDRCAEPGVALTVADNAIEARDKKHDDTVLALSAQNGATSVATAQGVAGTAQQPVRALVETGGRGSMATVEVGDATVGVIAPRCDLAEICAYDASNALCLEPDTNATNAVDGGAASASNTAAGGSALAGHR
jgi:Tfp pilus assembly protein FimT